MRFLPSVNPTLKRLYRYFLPYKLKLFIAGVFLLGAASMSSLTAILLGKLTDLGFYGQETWVIVAAPVALILVTLLFAVSTVMSSFLMACISQSVLVTVRTVLFEGILRWPAEQYQKHELGLVSSKFVNESFMALSGAAESIIVLVRDSTQVIALMCILLWYNWQLTLVTLVIAPGLALILRAISKKMKVIVSESQTTLGKMISRVQESYEAERIVKVSGTYDFEEARFEAVNEKIRHLALNTIKIQSLATPLTQSFTMIAIALVVGIALWEAQQGLLTFGEFVTFLTAMVLLRDPIQKLTGLNSTFATITAAAQSIFTLMDVQREKDSGTKKLEGVRGSLCFDRVCLRYPGTPEDALKDVSFEVNAGEHIALVGVSGSGKTSIVNLIPRFWNATSGSIFLDGVDCREIPLERLRKAISIVSQDTEMFDGTIRENIVYGCEAVTQEAFDQAIEAAGLQDFIDSLPEKIETRVGEAGKLLSGGQRQRVAIARAFLKNAPILIFDEATSALDSETEKHIKEAIERLRQGKTCISVAHRFSTIAHVDRIVVLKQGKIVEVGSKEELLAKKGVFYELFSLQML